MPALIVLTIAGSDSGGGAGIQADLKTFEHFGVFGTSAITAITAQNTRAILRSVPLSAPLVRAQIDAVATDLRPRALKSGMLATAATVRTVARAIRHHALRAYVLDPVLVSTSGRRLLARDGLAALRRLLVPLADLVTPNLDEAAALTGEPVDDVPSMQRAARTLVDRLGARAALVTGGHGTAPTVTDVLYDGSAPPTLLVAPRIPGRHTHGTGCTLSAAIAARLALGDTLPDAVNSARSYVRRAIRTAPGLGAGAGPLNHRA